LEKILQKLKENRLITDIVIILISTTILLVANFNKSTDIYYDDGSQHLMRAFGSYQTLLEHKNINVISNFTNGFGYSWDLFYGPLSEYLQIVLGIIFKSFNLGFKMLIFIIMFLSGCFMYKFVYGMTDKRNTALLSGIIYITSPYFFTDIYIRHALGECIAFVFVPMVFLGLYNLFNTQKNHYYLAIGGIGLILSHNISTVLTVIFAFIYCLINIKNITNSYVKKGLIIDFVFIIVITAFFWGPFIETKFFTEYQVFEKNAMSTQGSIMSQSLSFKELFIASNNSTYIFEIGLPVILMIIFSFMTFLRLEENRKEYLFFLISGIACIWMSTKYFPWKILPNSFYIIQFPWRMLLFSTFFFAVVCTINMSIVIRKFNIKDVFIIAIICLIYIISKYNYIPHSEEVPDVRDYEVLSVSGQDNEWLPGMGRLEYLPTKAYNNTFYIATREKGIICLSGECEINGTKVTTSNAEVVLELPYIYYPGYTVRFDGIRLNSFETEHGFLGISIVENEQGTIDVNYTRHKCNANYKNNIIFGNYRIFNLCV